MRAHFSHLALGDDSTGDVIILRNIIEGLDGATAFFYTPEVDNSIAIEDNQRPNNYTDHTIDIRAMYEGSAEQATLESWDANLTKVRAAAYGIDGTLIWEEPSRMHFAEKNDGNLAWRAFMSKRTDCWRDVSTGKKHGAVHMGNNLLGLYAFGDADADGIANGFSSTFDSSSFSAGVQTVTHSDTDTSEEISRDIFWPFQKQVKLTVTVESLSNVSGYDSEIVLQSLDYQGNIVGSESTSAFGTTGAKTLTHTPPAGSYLLRVITLRSSRSSGTDVASYDIKNPVLRIDGSSAFTNE